MVKVFAGPEQPFAVGVTLMVDVMAVVPVLVAVNVGILPTPVAPRPVAVLLFAQSKVVPVTGPVKFTAVVAAPLHNVWLVMLSTLGVGFTVISNVTGVPVQPLAVGVTVTVDVIGAVPVLVAAKAAILPIPLAASPVLVLLFVQLKVVPVTALVKLIAVVVAPLHRV